MQLDENQRSRDKYQVNALFLEASFQGKDTRHPKCRATRVENAGPGRSSVWLTTSAASANGVLFAICLVPMFLRNLRSQLNLLTQTLATLKHFHLNRLALQQEVLMYRHDQPIT